MKRFLLLFLALVLCLGAIQLVFAQKAGKKPPAAPVMLICDDCGPAPTTRLPATPIPIDDATFFVQQQYRDFCIATRRDMSWPMTSRRLTLVCSSPIRLLTTQSG